MKGSELMIGDIVAVNNTPLQIAALGTAKAGFIDAKGEMFYHYYDNIAPIPLTAEILKKNGEFGKTSKRLSFCKAFCSNLQLIISLIRLTTE